MIEFLEWVSFKKVNLALNNQNQIIVNEKTVITKLTLLTASNL